MEHRMFRYDYELYRPELENSNTHHFCHNRYGNPITCIPNENFLPNDEGIPNEYYTHVDGVMVLEGCKAGSRISYNNDWAYDNMKHHYTSEALQKGYGFLLVVGSRSLLDLGDGTEAVAIDGTGFHSHYDDPCLPCPLNFSQFRAWNDAGFDGSLLFCKPCPDGTMSPGNGRVCGDKEDHLVFLKTPENTGINLRIGDVELAFNDYGHGRKHNFEDVVKTIPLNQLPCGRYDIICEQEPKRKNAPMFIHNELEYRCGDTILISHPLDTTCASKQEVIAVRDENLKK